MVKTISITKRVYIITFPLQLSFLFNVSWRLYNQYQRHSARYICFSLVKTFVLICMSRKKVKEKKLTRFHFFANDLSMPHERLALNNVQYNVSSRNMLQQQHALIYLGRNTILKITDQYNAAISEHANFVRYLILYYFQTRNNIIYKFWKVKYYYK